MLNLHRLKNLLKIDHFSETVKRFTLPSFCAAVLTLILIGQIFEMFKGTFTDNTILRLSFILVASFCAFVALKLYAESRQWQNKKYFSLSAFAATAITLIVFSENYYCSFLLVGGLFLSISSAPFLAEKNDNDAYCHFSCSLSNSIFFSLLAAGILSLGTSAILASVHYLFELNIDYKAYLSTSVLYFFFFVPLYFLSGIPQDFKSENSQYPRGIKFITKFILIPLLAAYSVILYAYMIKILVLREFPKGVLSMMVLGFGSFGVLTHFFSYPLSKESNKLVKLFSRYFYHSLLAPLGFLFFAISKRVSEYGITEERYLILLMGLWLTVSCLHTIFTKARNLKFVTISLAALFIFASFGSWSIVGVSQFSQVKRLENLLKKEGILVDEKIVKPTNPLSDQANQEISNIVSYIAKTHKIEAIKKWFPKDSRTASFNNFVEFVDPKEVMNDIGLVYSAKSFNWLYFSMKDQMNFDKAVLDMRGFDYGINFFLNDDKPSDFSGNGDASFNISLTENNLVITDNRQLTNKIDLTDFVNRLRTSTAENRDFTLEVKSENMHVRLYAKNISANLADKPKITGLNGLLFIKML